MHEYKLLSLKICILKPIYMFIFRLPRKIKKILIVQHLYDYLFSKILQLSLDRRELWL